MDTIKIKRNFGHKLIGNKYMQGIVLETLKIFPDKVSYFISKRCWFVGSFDDGWAFTLRGKDVKDSEFVIFLSDELLRESEFEIKYTIAHEIGHVILGHRNSIGVIQTKKEIEKQEKEAHDFARKYLISY